MLKKKLPWRASQKSFNYLLGYTQPKLHIGKRWFVDFFAYDPSEDAMRRKKYMINPRLTQTAKRRTANEMIAFYTAKLKSGWNPFTSESGLRITTDFQLVLDRYLEYVQRTGRKETIHSYTSRVNVFREYLATLVKPVRCAYQFDGELVAGFLDYILIDRECGARTRNNYLGWCNSLGEWMLQRKFIDENPCSHFRKISENAKKRQPLTLAMCSLMTEHLMRVDKHFLLACLMEYYTFIRPTELSHLKIGDFSIVKQTVFVSGAFSKNRRDGNVAINDHIIKLMLELGVFSYPGDFYLFGRGFRPSATRIGADQFSHRWVAMRRKLGWGEEYQFYSLKDTGIRDLANESGIVVARDQARHTDVSTTNKYLCGRDQAVHDEVKHFNGAIPRL